MGRRKPTDIDDVEYDADQNPPPPEKESTAAAEKGSAGEDANPAVSDAGDDIDFGTKKKKKKPKKKKGGKIPQKEENLDESHAEEAQAMAVAEVSNKKVSKRVRAMQEELARRREEEERRRREEEERIRKEEEERERLEEMERQAEEAKRRKKEREKEKRLKKKQEGKPVTSKQKEKQRQLEARRGQLLAHQNELLAGTEVEAKRRPIYEAKKSKRKKIAEPEADRAEEDATVTHFEAMQEEEDEDEWDAESADEVAVTMPDTIAEEAPAPVAEASDAGPELRSPICCILGHVDAGKTKLLDCIRGTSVQEGEAGGITQQIGATYLPAENIRERTKGLKEDAKLNVPGLLVIDTPGHESFANLRSRGSSLCDIAVLVVDIMRGLEPQTVESLNLLKSRNTEFIVALNKVDRLYGWDSRPSAPIYKAMKQQYDEVKDEFRKRLTQIETEFKEQGLNTALYYENKKWGETYNIVPTSAISGEGIPDLLLLLVQWAQKTMEKKLTYVDEVECIVLEVKVIEGHGTTIDVVLVNGTLHEGDRIVVCGLQGPIVTQIRALMTPSPMKELRVKGTYLRHKEIKAAQGVKISAQNLERAIAGTALQVIGDDDDEEYVKEEVMKEWNMVMKDMNKVISRFDKSKEGVYVQASTLGSLEALTEYLKDPTVNIPFCDFSIGPVHKRDVMNASAMLERNKKEYAAILAFDVKIMPDARELANETGVRIFEADIIYHLFHQFKAYVDALRAEKKRENAEDAVFPCVLKIMPRCVFNKKDPILLGVDVSEGILKMGTPICVPSRDFINLGKIASIYINDKQVDKAIKGQKVSIKIVGTSPEEQQKMFGRHFEMGDELVSRITRGSIDVLKEYYRDDLSKDDWNLVIKLKQIFRIP